MHLISNHMVHRERDVPTWTIQSSMQICVYLQFCCLLTHLAFDGHIMIVVR